MTRNPRVTTKKFRPANRCFDTRSQASGLSRQEAWRERSGSVWVSAAGRQAQVAPGGCDEKLVDVLFLATVAVPLYGSQRTVPATEARVDGMGTKRAIYNVSAASKSVTGVVPGLRPWESGTRQTETEGSPGAGLRGVCHQKHGTHPTVARMRILTCRAGVGAGVRRGGQVPAG